MWIMDALAAILHCYQYVVPKSGSFGFGVFPDYRVAVVIQALGFQKLFQLYNKLFHLGLKTVNIKAICIGMA